MPKLKNIFVLFFLLIPCVVFSEPMDFNGHLLEKGDNLFKQKKYFKAEFFYDAYLSENSSCEVEYKSGLCKIYTKQYEKALVNFKKISHDCNGKIGTFSYFYLSKLYLQLNEPGLALISLTNIEKLSTDTVVINLAVFEKIWFYLKFNQVDKALAELSRLDYETLEKLKAEEFKKEVQELNKDVKSPKLSGLYSIIPGGGYLYCNRYKDAAFAFFLNTLLAVSTYEAFDNDMNALGVLLGGVTSGFYAGNIYGGIRAANFENARFRNHVYENLEKKFRKNHTEEKLKIFEINFGF